MNTLGDTLLDTICAIVAEVIVMHFQGEENSISVLTKNNELQLYPPSPA